MRSLSIYQKLVVTDDAKTLLGGVFVGDASPYTALRPLLGRELPAEPGAFLSSTGAGWTWICLTTPRSAPARSRSGHLRCAVRGETTGEPVSDMGGMKKCNKVGTQCGSCIPMAKKIMEKEMAVQGMEVSAAMCEHFDDSRQALFAKVKDAGLRSFTEVVDHFGSPPTAPSTSAATSASPRWHP